MVWVVLRQVVWNRDTPLVQQPVHLIPPLRLVPFPLFVFEIGSMLREGIRDHLSDLLLQSDFRFSNCSPRKAPYGNYGDDNYEFDAAHRLTPMAQAIIKQAPLNFITLRFVECISRGKVPDAGNS